MIEFTCITQISGNPIITLNTDDCTNREIYLILGMIDQIKSDLIKMLSDEDG